MPYSGPGDSKLPKNVRNLPENERAQWVEVWNSAYQACQKDGGDDCEAVAFQKANGAVLKDNMQCVVNRIGKVRAESLGGRQFLVAPVVSICKTVMNGEMLLPEEFGRHPASWDGRPVVLGHPLDNRGLPVSANSPDILDQYRIGQVYNTQANGKLKHEIWIDIALAQQTADGKEVLRRLESKQPVEVSTAYFRDLEGSQGTYNGKQYWGITRNIRPDHLAILLHEKGACSWEDGCGAPRVNMGATQNRRDAMSDKISRILDAGQGFTKEGLAAMSECELDALLKLLPEGEDPTVNADVQDNEEDLQDDEAHDIVAPDLSNAVREAVESAFEDVGGIDGLKKALVDIASNADKERNEIIGRLTATQRCALTHSQLEDMDTPTLNALWATVRPVSYLGRGAEPPQVNDAEIEEYPVPRLFQKEA
jgi:hypothetical protein